MTVEGDKPYPCYGLNTTLTPTAGGRNADVSELMSEDQREATQLDKLPVEV